MRLSSLITPASSARYDKTRSKGDDPCDVCGRPLKNRTWFVVEHYETGELVPVDADSHPSHHCVYIGSECAKLPELKSFVRRDG